MDCIVLAGRDNVAVATRDLAKGAACQAAEHTIQLVDDIRAGHKVALARIALGEPVVKYGQIIGFATQPIAPGAWVHSHNLAIHAFERDYAKATATPPSPAPLTGYTFEGYRRADGRSGTRNYIAVISSVNCSATVCKAIARRFDAAALAPFENVDGVIAITHGGGCGIGEGEYRQLLSRVLGGMAKHPNIGGYVLIGLGCETMAIGSLMREQNLVQISNIRSTELGQTSERAAVGRPPVLVMQDLGGTTKTIEAGVQLVEQLLPKVNAQRRETIPASEIVLGAECGGSDAYSGITANPALGVASDLVVACGGTAILAETPEIYGAEQLLTRRARSVEVADKLIERIRWWEWYTGVFGGSCDNNPSPGNKEGGLTTIYEKSLGAVAKGGSTALNEVYLYAEEVRAKGLVVMDTPGFDPVSVTGLVAGGANVVVFTTGRGSCFGCKPTPSIKVATNTQVYERMRDDMDLNAGAVLEGQSVDEMGRRIFAEILAVASGKRTKSEQLGIGDDEFVPWALGPQL